MQACSQQAQLKRTPSWRRIQTATSRWLSSTTLEQLQQMQARAAAIAAGQEDIQQCTLMVHELRTRKYSRYINLRKLLLLLNENIDSQRLGFKQRENEHSLRMDRERAELKVVTLVQKVY